jgi:hypothetical protein
VISSQVAVRAGETLRAAVNKDHRTVMFSRDCGTDKKGTAIIIPSNGNDNRPICNINLRGGSFVDC